MESLDDEPLPRTGQLGRLHLDMRLAQSAWMERWVPQALGLGSAGGELDDQEDELLLEGKELFDRYRATHALLADVQRGIDETALELAGARAALHAQGEPLRPQNTQIGQDLRFAREAAGSLT